MSKKPVPICVHRARTLWFFLTQSAQNEDTKRGLLDTLVGNSIVLILVINANQAITADAAIPIGAADHAISAIADLGPAVLAVVAIAVCVLIAAMTHNATTALFRLPKRAAAAASLPRV